jgi:serine/threonine-protein kinase
MNRSIVILALVACPALALAGEPAPSDSKRDADTLFNQGKSLLEARRFTEACAKLEASQKLDRALGTLLNLADCYEQSGRTASAFTAFAEAAAWAKEKGQAERERVANERTALLARRLSQLTIHVSAEVAALGVEVKRNGTPVERATWDAATSLDPGEYLIEARAPRRRPWSRKVALPPGPVVITVQIAALEPEVTPPPPPPVLATSNGGPAPAEAVSAQQQPGSDASLERALAFTCTGVAVAALATTIGLSVHARSQWNDAQSNHCSGSVCDQAGVDLARNAKLEANVATATTVVTGVAAVGAGVLFWLSSRGAGEAAPATRTGLRLSPFSDGREVGVAFSGTLP